MPNEIYAQLLVTSLRLEPDEITARTGLNPGRSWKTGDIASPATIMKRKENGNGWILASGLDRSHDLDAHLTGLVKKIAPRIDRFRDLPECGIKVDCVLYA